MHKPPYATPTQDRPDHRATDATVTRRPYEAPAILEDLPLETYSLACSKADIVCDPTGTSITS